MITNIPKHWKIKKLGEIGIFFKGKGVPKNKITDTGFKCLTYGDLYTKYDFVIEGVKSFIDKKTALISQEIRYGDICFAGSGETLEDIGKCATFIDDEIGYAGGDIIVFRTEQNPIVMSYLLNSDIAKKQKFSMGQGHSVVHIYSSQLEMLKLPLPPLKEQEKIAEILLTFDKAIRLTTQIITQLKQRNQGLAQQLLTGEKRVKGFENSVWKEVRLGEIGFFFKGKGVSKNKIIDKGFKCLTYGDLYTKYDFIIKDVKSFIDKETALISQEIRYGDICFAGSGETLEDIGKCATFIDDEIGYAGGDIIVFRTKQNPITMSYLLNSDIVKKQKTKMGQGHSVVHIYSSQLEKLEVSLPSLTEQNAIAQILDTAHQELKLYEQKLQLLQAQKKTLMQKLLTGEVLTIKK